VHSSTVDTVSCMHVKLPNPFESLGGRSLLSSGWIAFSECKRGPKPSGLAEEAKAEAFETLKSSKEKEESVSSGRSYNYRQISRG
jgi:hypothetical protein